MSRARADPQRLDDPLAHLRLTTNAYRLATVLLDEISHQWTGGRWLATGGGGYDAYRVVPRSWSLVWLAQAHRELPAETAAGWRAKWSAEAERYGVLVMDFQHYPVAEDPRLWFEDRLHGNELGHQRMAAAFAWRLGIAGADESWAEPLDDEVTRRRFGEQLASDVGWVRRYLGPWLGKGIRGIRQGRGIQRKRPIPEVLPRSYDETDQK